METKNANIISQIAQLTNAITLLDKKNDKIAIADIKGQIKENTKESKAIEKEIKAFDKAATKQVKIQSTDNTIINIEDTIFRESRERIKELMVVYQALKESAIDCKILQKFHGNVICGTS